MAASTVAHKLGITTKDKSLAALVVEIDANDQSELLENPASAGGLKVGDALLRQGGHTYKVAKITGTQVMAERKVGNGVFIDYLSIEQALVDKKLAAQAAKPSEKAQNSDVAEKPKNLSKEDAEHLFGVPQKRAAALDRIATGKAWFGDSTKARAFLSKNGLKDTHEFKQTKPGRFDIVEKASKEPLALAVTEQPAIKDVAEPAPPEFVKVRAVDGTNYHVKQSDLDGAKPLLPLYTSKGERKAGKLINRENLDPAGEKQAAQNTQDADNPFFDVITAKQGSPFATAAAAQRELNTRALGDSHEVVPASEVKDGAPGFVLRKKPAGAVKESQNATGGRDTFTLTRLNRETNKMEPVTFQRGEYVRHRLGTTDHFGDIDGISQAKRQFSVDGLWYDFGFAYKAERPPQAKAEGVEPLSAVIDKPADMPAFSRKTSEDQGPENNALQALSENSDLFALPKSEAKSVEAITAEADPAIKVEKTPDATGRTVYKFTMPDGKTASMSIRPFNKYATEDAPTLYGYTLKDGQMTELVTERPGTNPDEADGKDDVWVDVSNLTTGGRGAEIYNIAETFAHNTGRIFIGDPAGLTDAALRRRTEQMLSSALKFGTTEHLAPHPRQVDGAAALGVPPLNWTYGDDIGNIKALIDVSVQQYANVNPITFEPSTGRYLDSEGVELDDDAISLVVRVGRSAEAGIGLKTAKRNAVLDSLVREGGSTGGSRGQRAGLLERLVELTGQYSASTRQLFYSKSDSAGAGQANQAVGASETVEARAATAEVERIVAGITSRWANSPNVVVAYDMNDPRIPERVRSNDQKQRSGGATGSPEGFYFQGTAYVLSSQVTRQKDVARVLFHEVLGHAGLRGVFGDQLNQILDQLSALRRGDIVAKARQYGEVPPGMEDAEVKDVYAAMSVKQRRVAAEEVLAELAQSNPQIGFVRRAIAIIRTWIRRNLPGMKNMRLTDAEIVMDFIIPARGFIERGRADAAAPDMAPAFSARAPDGGGARTPQTETAKFKAWFGDSKAVDADGKPLVVYHGTNAEFAAFDPEKTESLPGVFMSADPETASVYAQNKRGAGANVMPLYVSLQNPRVITSSQYSSEALSAAYTDGSIDGVIVKDRDTGAIEIVIAFKPEQIKSSIGNNGDFDPTDADIRFSRTLPQAPDEAIEAITVTDLTRKFGNRLADFRGLALQALGRRQLVDIYAKDLPMLTDYSTMVAQMDADKNESGAEADELATRWGKLKDERQLADLMHDATLAQIDPSKPLEAGDDENFYEALRDGYQALSPEAQKAFTDARDMYAAHHEQVRKAIRERIERSELSPAKRKALLEKMDGEFFKKVKGVYFPLARFGQYVTIVKDDEGSVVSSNRSETLNEAEATRKMLLRQFPESGGFKVGKVLRDREFNAARDGVGRGFMADLFETLDKTGAGDELQDAISQLYLAALPDLSWAKHGIHRKGTPGFSSNARRAFAKNMFHGARYLAKLRYADQLQNKLDDMQKHVDMQGDNEAFDSPKATQVIDEMVKRHDSMMNPQTNPLSTALTSFGFIFHLGLSPASAMVNMSQTALVALPVMGAKWGFAKASAALLFASKQAASNKNDIGKALTGDELRAYEEAVRSGVIDVTMAHDLAGIAQGEDSGVNEKLRPVMKWASFLFHHAERFNRQVTFVAAYRLARQAGVDHGTAFEQATKATYDGHFDYGSSNRPRVMQGNTAKVVLLFKQYAQNMIYTLTRQAQQAMKAETPAARAEARRVLGGLLVSHAMAAGVLGLPVVGMLLSAASALGGDDDEPWDAKVALQNMLADAFGQKAAEVMAHGVSRLTPWDISGRVGLDRLLLPDVQEGLEGARLAESWTTSALGPVVGIGVNAVKGLQEIAEGRYIKGLEAMMPAALRGPLKAYRYGTEGNIDKSGIAINEQISAAGVAGQVLGFSPSEVRLAQEGKSAIYSADRAIQDRRSNLVRQFALAAMATDEEGKAEAREEIARFNEKNPKARITPVQLMQSVRARQKRIRESQNGVYLPSKRREAMEAGRFAEVD